MQTMCPPRRKVGPEPVASHIFELMFVGYWGNSDGGVLADEGAVEEEEVGETATGAECGFVKGWVVGLERWRVSFVE